MTSTFELTTSIFQAYQSHPAQLIPESLQQAALPLLERWELRPESFPASFPGPLLRASQPSNHKLVARELVEVTQGSPLPHESQAQAVEYVIESPELEYESFLSRMHPHRQRVYFSGSVDYLALADLLCEYFPEGLQGGFGSKVNPDLPGFTEGLLRKTSFSEDFKPFRLVSLAEENIPKRLSHILHSLDRWIHSLPQESDHASVLLAKTELAFELTGDALLDAVSIQTLRFLLHHFQSFQQPAALAPLFVHAYSHQSNPAWVLSLFDSYGFTDPKAQLIQQQAPLADLVDVLSWIAAQQSWEMFTTQQS